MACLFAILVLAFPRVAIVLLYLFTNFFSGVYTSIIVPLLGFLFLPLTLITYTYLLNAHISMGLAPLCALLVAIVLDLGLVGGAARQRR
jgi:hypothetical protein